MNKYKFQLFDKDAQVMREVLEIDFEHNYAMCKDGTDIFHYDLDTYNMRQYTGLKDKNGKEIYEGDLWKTVYYFDGPPSKTPKNKPFIEVVLPVVFQGGTFELDERGKRYYPYSTTFNDWWKQGEVIGNIYETPAEVTT